MPAAPIPTVVTSAERDDGYSGDGLTCTNIDECADSALNNCDVNASCVDNDGGFSCFCNIGYEGDGVTCLDIDECSIPLLREVLENNCHANAGCVNTDGSYLCGYDVGYTGDGFTCENIDECDSGDNNCNANAFCIDTDGSHNNCDANANCVNNVGSYDCGCNDGYSGDGITCTDIDERQQ